MPLCHKPLVSSNLFHTEPVFDLYFGLRLLFALIDLKKILKSTFRFGDVLGRLGGDEFVVYMTLTSEIEVVERRLRELKDSMLNKLGADEDSLPEITCSIGCCIARKGDNFESIYKRADAAMYESKLRGKGQFTIVD